MSAIGTLGQNRDTSLDEKLAELATFKTNDYNTLADLFCTACSETKEPIPFELARAVIDRVDFPPFYTDKIATRLFIASAESTLPGLLPEQNSIAESLLVVALHARRTSTFAEREKIAQHWRDFDSGVNMG